MWFGKNRCPDPGTHTRTPIAAPCGPPQSSPSCPSPASPTAPPETPRACRNWGGSIASDGTSQDAPWPHRHDATRQGPQALCRLDPPPSPLIQNCGHLTRSGQSPYANRSPLPSLVTGGDRAMARDFSTPTSFPPHLTARSPKRRTLFRGTPLTWERHRPPYRLPSPDADGKHRGPPMQAAPRENRQNYAIGRHMMTNNLASITGSTSGALTLPRAEISPT